MTLSHLSGRIVKVGEKCSEAVSSRFLIHQSRLPRLEHKDLRNCNQQ